MMAVLDPNPIFRKINYLKSEDNDDPSASHQEPFGVYPKYLNSPPSSAPVNKHQQLTGISKTETVCTQMTTSDHQVSVMLLRPLREICANLANAWDLGDLADDLKRFNADRIRQ
jgi:hypothetical protein